MEVEVAEVPILMEVDTMAVLEVQIYKAEG